MSQFPIHADVGTGNTHVIQYWEVANEAARLALVPRNGDIGRIARQLDDGSFWVCAGVFPSVWSQMYAYQVIGG
jgi:hypothetical protein